MVKKKQKISGLTIILILFLIFSTLSSIGNMANYSSNNDIYDECKSNILTQVEDFGYREIYICGAKYKIERLEMNVSLITSMILLFLVILSWKFDKLKND